MSEFIRQRQEVIQLLESVRDVARRLQNRDVEDLLSTALDRVTKGQLFAAVCGEFKQGKSTLINALLGETDLFPVDIDVTTSLVTTISYAEHETISVWFEDRDQGGLMIDRQAIPAFVTEQGNPGNHRAARLLAIESPNAQLRDGLVLVDTPGVGGLNMRHSEITLALIPDADAILFVSDAFAPLSQNELTFICESILPHSSSLIFVVTKIDQNLAYKAVIRANRERLATLLGCAPDEILILGVSSRNKLDFIASCDTEDLADSRFPELESMLWRVLNERRGHLLTLRGLAEAHRAVRQLRAPLQASLEGCRADSQKEIDAIDAKLYSAIERLRVLEEDSASWRLALSNGLNEIRRVVLDHELDVGAVRVRMRFDRLSGNEVYLLASERLVEIVQADISALATTLTQSIARRATVLQARIEAASAIHLTAGKLGPVSIDVEIPDLTAVGAAGRGVWAKVVDVGKEASLSSAGAGMLGSILGGVIGVAATVFSGGLAAPALLLGAQIGAAIGTIAGAATGIKRGLSHVNAADREAVRQIVREAIKPFLEESLVTCRANLDGSFSYLQTAMSEDLLTKMAQERKSLERARTELAQTRGLTSAQVAQRVAEIQAELETIEELERQADAIAQCIFASTSGAARAEDLAQSEPVDAAQSARQ